VKTNLKPRDIFIASAVILLLIFLIDKFTNQIDILKYDWDFNYYIALSQYGFNARPLLTPFAYRYITPFLAALFRIVLGVSTNWGFKIVAYLGAFGQLMGIFLIAHYFTHSKKSSYVAMLVTAFSLFNVKFLQFDVYRPDHLAYAFILLEFYFVLKGQFIPLLIATAIGVQIREHTIIPLIAYLLSIVVNKDWKLLIKNLLPSAACIFIAFVLPRLLIPVQGTVQKTDFSLAGLGALVTTPLMVNNDLNFLFTSVVYFLPFLMLFTVKRFKRTLLHLSMEVQLFLIFYTILSLLMSLYGGSDLMRYATYLFLPNFLLVALFCGFISNLEIGVMVVTTFLFNKIWLSIPMDTMDHYLDFYGGYGARVNLTTAERFAEFLVFIAIAISIRWLVTRYDRQKARGSGMPAR
jgi:hypothetical protein